MSKDQTIIIKNIYYMLAYVFDALNKAEFQNVGTEEFDNIFNLYACILETGISQQIKRGLYREYQVNQDDMTSLRGKIDMAGTIRNKISQKQVITCEYDDLTEDNRFNQIIKTTVLILCKHSQVKTSYKEKLKKEMRFFEHVSTLKPHSIKWKSFQFHRNNQTYQMLISICQFIILGVLLTTETTEDDKYKLSEIKPVWELSKIYEKFILRYYEKNFPKYKPSAAHIPWALDDSNNIQLPRMESDILLTEKDKTLIIDAKFYSKTLNQHHDSVTVHSNNLYQIFAYVKNKAAQKGVIAQTVSGLLLYARTESENQPDNVYFMSGNKISVKTLDLNVEFKVIEDQLKAIIADHFT